MYRLSGGHYYLTEGLSKVRSRFNILLLYQIKYIWSTEYLNLSSVKDWHWRNHFYLFCDQLFLDLNNK